MGRNREPALIPLIGLLAGFATSENDSFSRNPVRGVVRFHKTSAPARTLAPTGGDHVRMHCADGLPVDVEKCGYGGESFFPVREQVVPESLYSDLVRRVVPRISPNLRRPEEYWQAPYETAVRGGILGGLLGPVFLLVPIGLLSLKWSLGRQAILAAAVFASTYPANVGTRFLIPAAPFLAFAMAMSITQWRAMAPILILTTP